MPTVQQLFRRKPVPEMSAESGTDSGTSYSFAYATLGELPAVGVAAQR